jgi:hypothetical protein
MTLLRTREIISRHVAYVTVCLCECIHENTQTYTYTPAEQFPARLLSVTCSVLCYY